MITGTCIGHYIGGRIENDAASYLDVFNPALGEVTAQVALGNAATVNRAVQAAVEAFPAWAATSPLRRSRVMFRFRELLERDRKELAALITAEHGKTLSDAEGEVMRGMEVVEFACGIPHLLKGEFTDGVSGGVDAWSIRQPLGVVAGITPFNFPVMVPLWMIPVAIACGNCFVLKPSEKDPSPSIKIAELLHEAGLPQGVFSVVQGAREAVEAIIAHPDIQAISFVGSTNVARLIYTGGAAQGKRVQALGGAKNHMVVLPDADVDMAADAAVSAAYGAAGERCMAISVAVAVGDIGDRLVDAIATRLPKLVIGNGAEPGVDMGPLITAEHRDKVASYIAAGAESGATVVVDGRPESGADVPADGFYLGTTLLDHVKPDMSVYTDEIFGPVLDVVRVDTYEQGLNLINSNEFANGTAIFTRDGGAARQFQFDVEVGMVGINVPIPVPVAYYSFGGWKNSLFGDTHMYGPEGINFYTRGKVITSRWPDPATSTVDLGFPRTR